MSGLPGWDESSFTAEGRTFPVFRQGTGPGVIVIHESPNITPQVARFGQDVVDAGFTVLMPSLSGTPGERFSVKSTVKTISRVCVSSEFETWRAGRTSPITVWLRALAKDLHDELGGPGVGALGMCMTGGFALAMMVDGHVAAPVLSQPSMPFAVLPHLRGDLNLSPADLTAVKERVAAGCPVLGLRYTGDPNVGTRFDTLRRELGDGFIAVELPGRKHSVLTLHRDEPSVQRVLDFFRERLHPAPS
jgi:dienelactone hydrolase